MILTWYVPSLGRGHGPQNPKIEGGLVAEEEGMLKTVTRLSCASWPRTLPREGRTRARAGLGPVPEEEGEGCEPPCNACTACRVCVLPRKRVTHAQCGRAGKRKGSAGTVPGPHPPRELCRLCPPAWAPGPPRSCLLLHFFNGRRRDLKVVPSLHELTCLGFVPVGAGARKERGESGAPVPWGARRDPGNQPESKSCGSLPG